ncbi:enterotoxin, partial [Bacillus toyonensis]|uniref:HBL/NHE enterotoxin family protein n=1 Tax=Bacillus toyonensis TaxID=155322 RepID=UPI000C02E3B4
MKKTLITGLLITAVSTSFFIPVNAYSKEGQTEVNTVYTQNVIDPNTLSNPIRMLGSQSPLIQAYGLIILQQPDIKVNAMSSLTNHQKFAKANVRKWIDEYNPRLIDLNQ